MPNTPFQKMQKLFINKKIAIVGNASIILNSDQGALIDAYDIVIRMNRGNPVSAKAQGTKFDLWCFSTAAWVKNELKTYPKVSSVWMSPRLRETYDGDFPCSFYPLSDWEQLSQTLGERPSVGCMVVNMVSGCKAQTAGVFGFDFKTSGTFYEERQHLGVHNYDAEKAYILNQCEKQDWAFTPC